MKTEEQVWKVVVDSNPVPDVNVYGREQIGGTAYLATLEKRSSEMTQVDTKPTDEKGSGPKLTWLVAAVLAVVAGVAVIWLNQSNEGAPATQPTQSTIVDSVSRGEERLAAYAAAVNEGEVVNVMGNYAPNPIVKRHPYAVNDYMDFTSAVRDIEALVPGYLGSEGRLEIFDMVAGDPNSVVQPDVTFSWRFYFGADGAQPSGWLWSRDDGPDIVEGDLSCIGGRDAKMFMTGDKILEINWGFQDVTKCES